MQGFKKIPLTVYLDLDGVIARHIKCALAEVPEVASIMDVWVGKKHKLKYRLRPELNTFFTELNKMGCVVHICTMGTYQRQRAVLNSACLYGYKALYDFHQLCSGRRTNTHQGWVLLDDKQSDSTSVFEKMCFIQLKTVWAGVGMLAPEKKAFIKNYQQDHFIQVEELTAKVESVAPLSLYLPMIEEKRKLQLRKEKGKKIFVFGGG